MPDFRDYQGTSFVVTDEGLTHFGIKGMKWGFNKGKRNGGRTAGLERKMEQHQMLAEKLYKSHIPNGALKLSNRRAYQKALNSKIVKAHPESKDSLARYIADNHTEEIRRASVNLRKTAYQNNVQRVNDIANRLRNQTVSASQRIVQVGKAFLEAGQGNNAPYKILSKKLRDLIIGKPGVVRTGSERRR